MNPPAEALLDVEEELEPGLAVEIVETIVRCSTPRQMTWYHAGLGSCVRGILRHPVDATARVAPAKPS